MPSIFNSKERGQAIVLVGIALVGLLAIMGLVIDGGVYLNEYSRLKRAVDAGAISAALQLREGYTISELSDLASEFIILNAAEATDLIIETCDDSTNSPPPDDPLSKSDACKDKDKKLVRVTATKLVDFGFLPIIGIDNALISASAVGQAASVDAMLIIDASASMAFEGGGDPNRPDDPLDDPGNCNTKKTCQPFEQVKDVAINFADNLYYPFDRTGVVTFDTEAHQTQPLTSSKTAVISVLNSLRVYQPPSCDSPTGPCRNYDGKTFIGYECPVYRTTGDPSSCTSSNIGAGLYMAGEMFTQPPSREEAIWITILLAGGPANKSTPMSKTDQKAHPYGYCPSTTWLASPFCRDDDASDRHDNDDPLYDADDYARDAGDHLADPNGGYGSIVFTIGLGELVRTGPGAEPYAGELLLKYIAEEAGGPDANHGIYYFAPDASDLGRIFKAIAANIATRLSE